MLRLSPCTKSPETRKDQQSSPGTVTRFQWNSTWLDLNLALPDSAGILSGTRLGKTNTMNSAKLNKKNKKNRRNLSNFPLNLDPWTSKLDIVCKWNKMCKYHVNSMVISCSTYQKEGKECTWVRYLIDAVLLRLQIFRNLRVFFRQIYISKISGFTKKYFFSNSVWVKHCSLQIFLILSDSKAEPIKLFRSTKLSDCQRVKWET